MKPIFVFVTLVAFAYGIADDIAVSNFKIGFLAKDQQASGEHLKTIQVFSKATSGLKADATQRIFISFNVNKKADNSKITPQQVFLRFEHSSGEDVVLVVNPQADGSYLYDTGLRAASKQFNNLSGAFKASLLVGGSNVKTAINWHFADLELNLPTTPVIVPKSQQVIYDQLPVIEHQFRQPEQRPSAFISDVFTIICLSPLVFLIAAWLKIGINFKNAPGSIWVPVFHLGLAAILGLYIVFWLQLDMFATLKYLSILGFFTFVAGNRVLRSLASEKTKSE